MSSRGQALHRPVAFVLASGANLGAVQVGMLHALFERGIAPDLVVGCSIGAVNGACLAGDPSVAGVARLERLWRTIDVRHLMPGGRISRTLALMRPGEAVHRSDGLRALLERGLPAAAFDELQIPFHCVATDAAEARERWFDEGRLVDAVLASAAMPALFPAVEIDGRRYIDGAVVSDVPVGRAADLGARTIYVLDVGRFPGGRPATRRPLDRLLEAYWITRFDRYRRALDALPHGVAVHLLPPGDPPRLRLHDFSRSADLIRSAYRASLAYLDDAGHPGVTAARNEASAMSSAADASARWVRRISASPP